MMNLYKIRYEYGACSGTAQRWAKDEEEAINKLWKSLIPKDDFQGEKKAHVIDTTQGIDNKMKIVR